MGLFGKKKISDDDAVYAVIGAIMKMTEAEWPNITASIKKIPHDDSEKLAKSTSMLEFACAIVAIEAKAIRNIFEGETAESLLRWLNRYFLHCEYEINAREAYMEYWEAWDQSIEEGEMPVYGVAYRYLLRIGYDLGEGSPNRGLLTLLLMVVGEQMSHDMGRWKLMAENFKIVS